MIIGESSEGLVSPWWASHFFQTPGWPAPQK